MLTNPPMASSRLARAWEALSDVLLVTAIIWAVPLLLGALAALVRAVITTR
jgi:hypothetical protein